MRFREGMLALALASMVAACATQQAMTVSTDTIGNPSPKYRNAVVVRSVTGGAAMNLLTMPGVTNEPLKAALEDSLRVNGYLAAGTPKFYVDAEINNLQQPFIGLDLDVTADVTYKVSGVASVGTTYPIKSTGRATFSDSLVGADRLRIANERAMQENIKQFLLALR
jgi:hypothetical protein